jgi:D-glycero-D-manno-heptose 1,7-bisphosphate phosphatase
LDRDGTVNEDVGYLHKHEDFVFIKGVPEALARLKKAGLALVVTTNQSGVARGIYSSRDVIELHRLIDEDLKKMADLTMDGWYFCPHLPDEGCRCRKPSPGLIIQASLDLGLDVSSSYMVGDKSLDVLAGQAAGAKKSILVKTGYGLAEQDNVPRGTIVADDLPSAASLILADFLKAGPTAAPEKDRF